MDGEMVSDIRLNETDLMGEPITALYGKVSNVYAVYGTPKRVMIQFADDPQLGIEQRRALSPLNPLRGQINGLLDGWRSETDTPATRSRLRIFDRRTADALIVALQGDQAQAQSLLQQVNDDILEEQASIGRADYLVIATISAFLVFLFFMTLSVFWADATGGTPAADAGRLRSIYSIGAFIEYNNVWLAAGFGSLGALFSIALGIRSREMRPDLQRRDNVIDAILRIMIGVVSAVVLFSLLRSQIVSFGFGGNAVQLGGSGGAAVHVGIVVAFVAGFTERLVGDYLSRASLDDRRADATAAAQQQAQRETEANEQNPRGRSETASAAEAAASATSDTPPGPVAGDQEHDHEEGVDGCLCERPLDDDGLTEDDELPAASGGIEKIAA